MTTLTIEKPGSVDVNEQREQFPTLRRRGIRLVILESTRKRAKDTISTPPQSQLIYEEEAIGERVPISQREMGRRSLISLAPNKNANKELCDQFMSELKRVPFTSTENDSELRSQNLVPAERFEINIKQLFHLRNIILKIKDEGKLFKVTIEENFVVLWTEKEE